MLEQLTSPETDLRPAAEASVWRRYLEETRAASHDAYEFVEDAAWRALCRRLERIGRPLPATSRSAAP
jgi:hypothetical protein